MKKILECIDIIVFALSTVFIDFIFRILIDFSLLSLKPLVFNSIIICILLLILILLRKKVRIIVEFCLIIIFSIYSFAQMYHYIYFNTVFSLKKISIFNEFWGVKDTIFSKFDIKLLFFFIPIIIFIILIFVFKSKISYIANKKKYIIVPILLFFLLSCLVFMRNYSKVESKNDIESETELYQTISNKNKFVNRYGLYSFLYRDLENIIFERKKGEISENDRDWINRYISNKKLDDNEYTGILEGKNLILIQAESLCPQVIDEYLTPTLFELKNNSLYFDNFYCPLYPENTCDTEFIIQTSLVPSIDYGTTSKDFANNNYKYSLAKLFNDKNYFVNSYHSFLKDFYNRAAFHDSLGFNYLYDYQDMSLYKPDYYIDYYDWIDDIELMKGTMQNTDLSNNFYNLIITASGHLPYMDLRPELFEFQEKAYKYLNVDPETAYYFASQMKLDESLNFLLEYLDANNLSDDTVIVLYGDHYPYGAIDETYRFLFSDLEYDYEKYITPLFIINPSLPKEKNSKLCSSFDLYPTLANMFNLDISNSFYIGSDIFSDDNCVVRFSDRSILTDRGYFSADMNDTNQLTDEERNDLLINKNIMKYSQLFLYSDFYNNE